MDNYIEKPFGWRRNLDYFKEMIIIKLKSIKEYKLNFYYGLIMSLIFTLTTALFLNFIYTYFKDIISWGFNEFFFFIFFSGSIAIFFGTFWFGMNLSSNLLNGVLNNYLVRPTNVFVKYITDNIAIFSCFNSFIYMFILICFFILNFNLFYLDRFIVVLFLALLAGIFSFTTIRFFDSLAFLMKSNSFLLITFQNVKQQFDRFPAVIFSGNLKIFSYLFYNVYYSSLATQFYFGYIGYIKLFYFIGILLVLILITTILIYLLWHYGLKKYEAFG